jgi:chemotaxis response regulator CheB
MPSDRIRVLIADDHPLYRTGLVDTVKRRPELELVGQAEDGAAALEEIRSADPDVCVLDVKMPGLGGVDVLRTLEREGLDVRVVFVSAYYDSDVVYGRSAAGHPDISRRTRPATRSVTRSWRHPRVGPRSARTYRRRLPTRFAAAAATRSGCSHLARTRSCGSRPTACRHLT